MRAESLHMAVVPGWLRPAQRLLRLRALRDVALSRRRAH
jgi:hypothetical protein